MKRTRIDDAVSHAAEDPVLLFRSDVAGLRSDAGGTKRRRARFCAHKSAEESLHEMFIAIDSGAYVRPHRHRGKAESLHVLEGTASLVLFSEDGDIREVVPLGAYDTGRCFYYRIGEPVFHTLLVADRAFLFHEVTTGPFRPAETEFPSWAPEDGAPTVADYQQSLLALATGHAARSSGDRS